MKFNQFDAKMRKYEESFDFCIPPDIWIVARLDGRSFHKVTELMQKPFCDHFIGCMTNTAKILMESSGFNVVYAYHQSDEISLLIHKDCNQFERKGRKLLSVLPSMASSILNMKLYMLPASIAHPVSFDCRLSLLPNVDAVIDYFRWRKADAYRNCINSYAYWGARGGGLDAKNAAKTLDKMSSSQKIEYIESHPPFISGFGGLINLTVKDIPGPHRNGIGIYREKLLLRGLNIKTNEPTLYERRKITVEKDLPYGAAYDKFICTLIF